MPVSLRPVPVLLYHRIEPHGRGNSTAISTPSDVFRSHLRWLADNGYRSLTLAELDARIDGAPPLAEREVVLTFDDGYDCLPTLAAPILRETGMQAASFLITGLVGVGNHLTWDQARELSGEGLVEFHSHSHTHPRWPSDRAMVDAVADELARSKELLIESLGTTATQQRYLAWPYGRTNDHWEQVAVDHGFTTQFVVQRGAVTRANRHHRLPRLMVDGMSLHRFSQWISALRSRPGAMASNRTFGTIRRLRQQVGYL